MTTIDHLGQHHAPAGIPSGGQFTAHRRSAPSSGLTGLPEQEWVGEPGANESAGNSPIVVTVPLPLSLEVSTEHLPELPEYPATLPPSSIIVSRDGETDAVNVWVCVGGDGGEPVITSFDVWETEDGRSDSLTGAHSLERRTSPWENGDPSGEETTEQLLEWANAVHQRASLLRYAAEERALAGGVSNTIADLAVGRLPNVVPLARASRQERATALLNDRNADPEALRDMLREFAEHTA